MAMKRTISGMIGAGSLHITDVPLLQKMLTGKEFI